MKLSRDAILYEDNHLLIVNKKPGLLTLPEGKVVDSLLTRAKQYVKEEKQKAGNVFLHPVHRLDKLVGGIVVLAKTSKALSRLNQQIREHVWEKVYMARLDHPPPKDHDILHHKILQGNYHAYIDNNGKEATLEYWKIRGNFVRIRLLTGRYHQIRIQFATIGCPICGDLKYGSQKSSLKGEGIDLMHVRLRFLHPTTQEVMEIDCENLFL